MDKLEDNLKVEQPSVRREEYEDLLGRHSVFCLGQNTTADAKGFALYEVGGGTARRFKEVTGERKRNQYLVSAPILTDQKGRSHQSWSCTPESLNC